MPNVLQAEADWRRLTARRTITFPMRCHDTTDKKPAIDELMKRVRRKPEK
jgi:hypothetical protein